MPVASVTLRPSITIWLLVTVSPQPSHVSPLPGPPHMRGMWLFGRRPSAIRSVRAGLSMLNLLASYRDATRQIHQGLGARGCANPKAGVQALLGCAGRLRCGYWTKVGYSP